MTASDHDISSPTSSVGAEPRAPALEAGSKPQPIQDSKPAHKPKHNKQQEPPTQKKKSKHRPVQSFEHAFSESKQKLPPTPSLPELNLTTYPRELAHKTYAQRYAASFGDASDFSDTEDPCADGVPSTENAKVLEFHPAAQRQPAMRVGAARLSEMMMYGRRSNQPQPVAAEALAAAAAAEDAKKEKAAVKRRNRRKHNRGSQPADKLELADSASVAQMQQNNKQQNPQSKQAPASECGSNKSSEHLSLILQPMPSTDIQEEEFNGLLARGAQADEKQRAKADGSTPFHTLLQLLQRSDSKRDREAKLFKPIIISPNSTNKRPTHLYNATTTDAFAFDGIDENGAQSASKFPFCCCAPRYCVAISFVFVLISALVGFFMWPRIPTLSISSLTALAPAQVVYDTERSLFGLEMPLEISYAIRSGNFYPLKISRVHVLGFDGVTGNKIIDTKLGELRVDPLRMQFHQGNATLHYLTSDMTDPALVDLFGKCAPKDQLRKARMSEAAGQGRPGALTIRFQIRVDAYNLGWLKQPIVTLNQNINCPE